MEPTRSNRTDADPGDEGRATSSRVTKASVAPETISVMVVDDHPMWRQTLRKVLERSRVGVVVAEASDGEEAIARARETKPDVAVMDLGLPNMNGIDATRRLVGMLRTIKVLVLSASDREADVLEAIRAGASGYLLKTAVPTDVVDAVRRIYRGEVVLPPQLADVVLGQLRTGGEPAGEPLRIALADTSALFRDGLGRMLTEKGFDVVGVVGDPDALFRCVAHERPDVVVTDARLGSDPSTEVTDLAGDIKRDHPEIGVLVLAHDVDVKVGSQLVANAAGGVGYLLKERVEEIGQLAEAIHRVAAGESVLDPEVAGRLVQPRKERDPLDELTPRESEVLALMAEGRSNRAISEQLFLSAKAVEGNVRNIFTKLGLEQAPDDHRRVLAVLTYLRSI